ncbi:hypothetical protein A8924_7094 [Saccharopolyspora erythraea NRRL 2338]|uniref:HD Cas3-type domain-containing protein n=2 Tax=Saccharopolyspora erythraea TaxID=1836 RepID=A4FPC9_SACEN|nr:HD domain-containing protein [Saccharopolyspora erythraea]EQD86719.1 hypothetical protein N599_08365 [Saccharopolyspora erythraea D]PFG99545.1 hypothetical protein A8924_7094 [Saccharopolyspora erythraea NRRL 2338]QRK89445.1 hypothetical protein JQX30_33730 [Saccharopolyspora erythraea]CAM05904.1 hypothetical protein SACE_6738 [Saccharopolyspora erythraea NRRL 2338]
MSALPHEPPGGELSETAHRLAWLSTQLHDAGKISPEFRRAVEQVAASAGNVRALGRARKVSVSMPEELTSAVQERVGRGAFSQYVTDAVARQLELDLLAELSDLLEAEHGPISEEDLTEARAAWPDVE